MIRADGQQPETRPKIVLAAGGTGGHVMPARALAEALAARGFATCFVTDRRGSRYLGGEWSRDQSMVLAAGRMSASLRARVQALGRMLPNFRHVRRFLRAQSAELLVSFGGYPTLPAALAARSLGVPVIVHEQNAVIGQVNRLIAPYADLLALTFPATRRLPARTKRTVVTGMPLRHQVLDAVQRPVAASAARRLFILGGSQGARILADVVPAAIALIAPNWRGRLSVVQQARAEDVERVRAAYAGAGIAAEVAPFFGDAPQRMAEADLVIARAGAGTLWELAALARPAVLIPFAAAKDDHQSVNARHFALAGAARVVAERLAEPRLMAAVLMELLGDAQTLQTMGRAMADLGRRDGTQRLLTCVEEALDGRTACRHLSAGRVFLAGEMQ